MKFLILNLLLGLSCVYASTPTNNQKMDLSYNGNNISSTRVIVNEGETTTITQKFDNHETSIDVVTNKADMNNNVKVNFKIGTSSKNGENIIMPNLK